MAKKKKVNSVPVPDAPPEVVDVIDEGEEVPPQEMPPAPDEDDVTPAERMARAERAISDTPGRAALRLRLEERESGTAPARFLLDVQGRYVATDGTKDLFVRIDGVRYEHVADDERGQWVYARS